MDIRPKTVTLSNHKSGETKEFTLRPFCCDDADSVLKCVVEEYGDTYYRREYYDKDLMLEQTASGVLFLFLAYCGDDVCGIQSLVSHAPKETRLEAASQIFRKQYRGYGLPYELVKYTYEIAKSLKPSCIYASMVVFHDITQKMCTDAGMTPVAFNFGSHITSKMHNSYKLGSSEKYAQAIMVLPVAKTDAGTLYIHPDISDVVEKIYTKLGVGFNIIKKSAKDCAPPKDVPTKWDVFTNEREQSLSVTVDTIGADFGDAIRKLKDKYSEKYWTIQLILPVDEECSVWAYEALFSEGFFFTGSKALCAKREQIFMQYIGDVYFCYDDFKLTEGFKELLRDIVKDGR